VNTIVELMFASSLVRCGCEVRFRASHWWMGYALPNDCHY